MKLRQSKEKYICRAIMIFFCASIIPIIVMSFFAHQSGDDYAFGMLTHKAVNAGGNIWDVISAAAKTANNNYGSWQGTYSAIFLMTLQPGVFGEGLYFLTTFILLAALIVGVLFLTHVFLRKYFSATKYEWIIISLVILTPCIQLLPSPLQAFYWFNGGVYYTFFFSVMLIYFAIMLLSIHEPIGKTSKIFYCIVLVLLSAFLGGGNYVTCLTILIAYALFLGVLAFQKRLFNKLNWLHIIPFAVFILGFAISAMAPGNAVRKANMADTPSAIGAILLSLENAVKYFDEWLTVTIMIILLLLIPFFIKIVKRSSFKFRFPLLISTAAFCVFAAMFCPPLYAMGNIGDDRLVDIIYFSFVLISAWIVFYWTGWVYHKIKDAGLEANVNIGLVFERFTRYLKKYALSGCAVIFALLMASMVCIEGTQHVTAFCAVESIATGEAQSYKQQYEERLELYLDTSVKEVYVTPYTVTPVLLHYYWMEDIGSNLRDQRRGDKLAEYYDKEFVLSKIEE